MKARSTLPNQPLALPRTGAIAGLLFSLKLFPVGPFDHRFTGAVLVAKEDQSIEN
jgi:hypothetical protein